LLKTGEGEGGAVGAGFIPEPDEGVVEGPVEVYEVDEAGEGVGGVSVYCWEADCCVEG